MEHKNNFSSLIDKNSLSRITKSSSYQNQKPKITTLIPESLKGPIQLIEQNNFEKFNYFINTSDISKSNLNSLLCFCLQNYGIKKNILDQIKLLIYKGADINTIYRNICELSPNISPKVEENSDITLLMYACLYNDKKLVEMFISKNNINSLDKNGKNALFYLFSNQNINQKVDIETAKIIKLLVNNGININCEAKFELGNKIIKQSPLSLAANYNYFISFKEMLNNGANLNFITEPEGDTILHIAVKKINHEMIKLILKNNNINLEIKNKEGKSARDLALEIEPDSIIYNLIVEKISESDNIERKKSDDLSFEEKSKKSFEQSDNNFNYLSENVIKNENNKDYTQIKSMLKKYNDNKKHLINKYIQQMKRNTNNIKLYVNLTKETQNTTSNKVDNIEKIVEYIVLENDENKRPVVNIDLLSKKFLNYKKSINNSNTANNNLKTKKKNYINKITFMNNNIDNNINININNDLSKKNSSSKLEEENFSLKKDLETVNSKKNELINNVQEKNNYINQLELKHKKEIDNLNNKITIILEEKDSLIEKIKSLEKTKIDLEERVSELEKEKDELNQNISQIKKEYSELNQKTEEMIKEKENEKLNKNIPIQNIKNNLEHYTNYLNKKFINFNFEKEYKLDCLSSDLIDFEVFVKLRIEKEQDIYDTLIKNVQSSVDKSIPDYEVNLYGSHATNLCLPWSDLDVVLIKKCQNSDSGSNINLENDNLVLLSRLYEYIRNEPWVKESKLIGKASVPIIKLIAIQKYNNMSIDISIQDEKHFGLKCVDLVNTFIKEYKSLKPIVLAIKNILKQANLNDPYKGGISSYGLILMIVYFFQKQKKSGIDIEPGENNSNLGKLFFEFIQFYGIFFDQKKEIININNEMNNKMVNEFDFPNLGYSLDLIIVDPLNRFNNVAKSCIQFYNIKMSFILCLKTLLDDCDCGCHYNQIGEHNDNLQIEHCFLKRIFNSVKRFE